jgi:hypothetical protein
MNQFSRTQDAFDTPFTPARNPDFSGGTNVLTALTTQEVIEELYNRAAVSASPGFTWGRSGAIPAGTYLQNDTVPSNTSGRVVFLLNAKITRVFVANQNATAGIIVNVYSHDGNGVNLALLGQVTTAALRTNTFTVNFAVAQNKQIALRTDPTSVAASNLVAGCLITGTIT